MRSNFMTGLLLRVNGIDINTATHTATHAATHTATHTATHCRRDAWQPHDGPVAAWQWRGCQRAGDLFTLLLQCVAVRLAVRAAAWQW